MSFILILCSILLSAPTVLANGQLAISVQNSTFISVQVQLDNGLEITEVTGSTCTKLSDNSDCLSNQRDTTYAGNEAFLSFNSLEPGNQFELSVTQVTYIDADGLTATMDDIGTILMCTLPIEPDHMDLAEPVYGDGTQFEVTITPLDPTNWDYFEVTAYDYYTNEECLRERSNDSSTSLDITLPKFGVVYRVEARAVLQCGSQSALKSLVTADKVIMTGAPEMNEMPDLIFQNESMACYNWFLSKENAHYTLVKGAFGYVGGQFEWGQLQSDIDPQQEAGVFCYDTPELDTRRALTLRISSSVVDEELEFQSNSVPNYFNYVYQHQRMNPTFEADCDDRSCDLQMNSQLMYVTHLNFPYQLSVQGSHAKQGQFNGSECGSESCIFAIDDLEPDSEYDLSVWIATLDGHILPFQFSHSFATETEVGEGDSKGVIVAVVVVVVAAVLLLATAAALFIGCKWFCTKYEEMHDKKLADIIPYVIPGNKYTDSPDAQYDEYVKSEEGIYSEYKEGGAQVDSSSPYLNADEGDTESVYENPVYDEDACKEKEGHVTTHPTAFAPSVANDYLAPADQSTAITAPRIESNYQAMEGESDNL